MGLCWARRMTAEDRAQEKVAEFVRYAIASDVVQLRAMITKRKMDPNAKDVTQSIPMAATRFIMLVEKIMTKSCDI
eukprot:jgi/Phyca11/116187/e_gw1.30.519.1